MVLLKGWIEKDVEGKLFRPLQRVPGAIWALERVLRTERACSAAIRPLVTVDSLALLLLPRLSPMLSLDSGPLPPTPHHSPCLSSLIAASSNFTASYQSPVLP